MAYEPGNSPCTSIVAAFGCPDVLIATTPAATLATSERQSNSRETDVVMTALLTDDDVLDIDGELLDALQQRLRLGRSSEPSLAFGVESERGQIYRLIRTDSLWEAGCIFNVVTALGFDILHAATVSRPRLSRVFRYRGATVS